MRMAACLSIHSLASLSYVYGNRNDQTAVCYEEGTACSDGANSGGNLFHLTFERCRKERERQNYLFLKKREEKGGV